MPARSEGCSSNALFRDRHGACDPGRLAALGLLLVATLFALAATAASALLSEVAAALVVRLCRLLAARRRRQARATEAGWLAARAQTWLRTPAPLGGPVDATRGFRGLTVDMLGLRADSRHPTVRQTAAGMYRLLPVPPCAALTVAAARLCTEVPAGGGLLVVGTGDVPEDAVAVLVLGPLVQMSLDAVPWALVRALTTPQVDPFLPTPAAVVTEPVLKALARRHAAAGTPQRERRMPSWRSPKPTTRRRDRIAVRAFT